MTIHGLIRNAYAVRCTARGLKSKGKVRADELLLQYVEEYFSAGLTHPGGKLRSTTLGPLYFQHPGKALLYRYNDFC